MATAKVQAGDAERQIALVNREYDAARLGLERSGADAFLSGLKSLRPNIDSWIQRGRDATRAGKEPKAKDGSAITWAGWSNSGNALLDGIHDQFKTGSTDKVENLEALKAGIVADLKKAPKALGTAVGQAAGAVAEAGGAKFAWGVGLPLVLGVGAVFALVLFGRKAVVG